MYGSGATRDRSSLFEHGARFLGRVASFVRSFRTPLAISGAVIVGVAVAVILLFSAVDAKSVKSAESPNGSVTTSVAGFLDQPELSQTFGHIAFFNDVRLEQGPGEQVMLAHDKSGRSMLVIVSQADAKVPAGTVADVMGIITPLPPAAKMRKAWKLSKDEAKARLEDGVYIEAKLVRAEK